MFSRTRRCTINLVLPRSSLAGRLALCTAQFRQASTMKSLQLFRLGAVAASVLALAACGDSDPQKGAKGAPPAPQVTVALPVKRTVTDRDEYVGRFVAIDSVEIRARVSGYLDAVQFTDGEIVKKGAPLFKIDQRPFTAALDQARADLARAKAQLDLANADLVRAQDLIERKTISEAIYEQRIQAKRAA